MEVENNLPPNIEPKDDTLRLIDNDKALKKDNRSPYFFRINLQFFKKQRFYK